MLELELIKLAFELYPVRVAVLSDVGRTPFIDEPLKRGTEVTVPLWLADVLRKLGKVEPHEDYPIHNRIMKVKFAHTSLGSKQGLPQVSDFFYMSTLKDLKASIEDAQQKMDIDSLTKLNKAVKAFNDIASRRLSFLLKAISLGGYSTIERCLSIEEKVLALMLTKILNEWKNEFLYVMEVGERT